MGLPVRARRGLAYTPRTPAAATGDLRAAAQAKPLQLMRHEVNAPSMRFFWEQLKGPGREKEAGGDGAEGPQQGARPRGPCLPPGFAPATPERGASVGPAGGGSCGFCSSCSPAAGFAGRAPLGRAVGDQPSRANAPAAPAQAGEDPEFLPSSPAPAGCPQGGAMEHEAGDPRGGCRGRADGPRGRAPGFLLREDGGFLLPGPRWGPGPARGLSALGG